MGKISYPFWEAPIKTVPEDHYTLGELLIITCAKEIEDYQNVILGVDVEDVKKDVPWELKISPDLSQTKRPEDREIEFIRKFAPAESMGRQVSTELAIGHVMKRAKERGKMLV